MATPRLRWPTDPWLRLVARRRSAPGQCSASPSWSWTAGLKPRTQAYRRRQCPRPDAIQRCGLVNDSYYARTCSQTCSTPSCLPTRPLKTSMPGSAPRPMGKHRSEILDTARPACRLQCCSMRIHFSASWDKSFRRQYSTRRRRISTCQPAETVQRADDAPDACPLRILRADGLSTPSPCPISANNSSSILFVPSTGRRHSGGMPVSLTADSLASALDASATRHRAAKTCVLHAQIHLRNRAPDLIPALEESGARPCPSTRTQADFSGDDRQHATIDRSASSFRRPSTRPLSTSTRPAPRPPPRRRSKSRVTAAMPEQIGDILCRSIGPLLFAITDKASERRPVHGTGCPTRATAWSSRTTRPIDVTVDA